MNLYKLPEGTSDEAEWDEKKRLEASASKTQKVEQSELERAAANATVKVGEDYERIYGAARVSQDELDMKSLFMAWSRIMGASTVFSISSVEAMMIMLQKLPMGPGLNMLLANKEYNLALSSLSAIRNKLIRERDQRIAASSPEIFTPGADGKR